MTNKRSAIDAFADAIADSELKVIELNEENIKKIKENIAETDREQICYISHVLIPAVILGIILANIGVLGYFPYLPLIIIIADVIFAGLLTIIFLYTRKEISEMGGCY